MKHLVFAVILFLALRPDLHAQYCGSNGIALTSQADVDNFAIKYPGCVVAQSYVFIMGDDITNLNGLSQLTDVMGDLQIWQNPNLNSLNGLSSLKYIDKKLSLYGNSGLTNLAGLPKLDKVRVLEIRNNSNFINLVGMTGISGYSIDELYLWENPSLTSLSGLEKLVGINRIDISDNQALTDISALSGITRVYGTLLLGSNNSLSSLNGLNNVQRVDRTLWLYDFKGTNLTGLNALTYVGADFFCSSNNFTDFSGLEKLSYVGEQLTISNNANLVSLGALNALTTVGRKIDVRLNPKLKSLSGLDNIIASPLQEVMILDSPLLSECSIKSICSYLRDPSRYSAIYNNAVGCASEEEVRQSGVCVAFPVKLVNFAGKTTAEGNTLTWQTTEEVINKGFEIEKSRDAQSFQKVGFIKGYGDTMNDQMYSFTDVSPFTTTYYRLKQLDFDGRSTYSSIIVVKKGGHSANVYPNPARGELHIQSANKNQPFSIRNTQGFSVMESPVLPSKPLDTSALQSGLYMITVGKEVFKVAVQN